MAGLGNWCRPFGRSRLPSSLPHRPSPIPPRFECVCEVGSNYAAATKPTSPDPTTRSSTHGRFVNGVEWAACALSAHPETPNIHVKNCLSFLCFVTIKRTAAVFAFLEQLHSACHLSREFGSESPQHTLATSHTLSRICALEEEPPEYSPRRRVTRAPPLLLSLCYAYNRH